MSYNLYSVAAKTAKKAGNPNTISRATRTVEGSAEDLGVHHARPISGLSSTATSDEPSTSKESAFAGSAKQLLIPDMFDGLRYKQV